MSRFLVFGEDHLRHLISTFVDYYHAKRSHRGLEHKRPGQISSSEKPEDVSSLDGDSLVLREALGGALKWYERKAA